MPFEKPNLNYTRRRTLSTEENFALPDPIPVAPENAYEQTMERLRKLRAKHAYALNELERMSEGQCIPVPPRKTEVRAAVARLMGTGDGSCIPFSLWRRLWDEGRDRASDLDIPALRGQVTGSRLVDVDVIQQVENDTDSDYLRSILHLGILLAGNQLMAPFSAPDDSAAVSGKTPSSTEMGPLIARVAIGFATFAAIHGTDALITALESGDMNQFLQELTPDPSEMKEFMEQAKGEAERFYGAITNIPGTTSADALRVREYGSSWLTSNLKQGFEQWLRYPQTAAAEERLKDAESKMQAWVDNISNLPDDIVNSVNCDADSANRSLDRIVAALNSGFTRDALCCLIRAFSEMGVRVGDENFDWLRKVRSGLSLYVAFNSGFDIFGILQNYANKLSFESRMRAKFEETTSSLVQSRFKEIEEQILSLLEEAGLDYVIEACPIFENMLNLLLQALEVLQRFLIEKIQSVWLNIDTNDGEAAKIDLGLPLVERAKRIIAVIDAFLDAVKLGDICSAEQPNSGPQSASGRDLGRFLRNNDPIIRTPTFSVPEPIGDPDVDFQPVSWEHEGIKFPYGPESSEDLEEMVSECMRKIPGDRMPSLRGLRNA